MTGERPKIGEEDGKKFLIYFRYLIWLLLRFGRHFPTSKSNIRRKVANSIKWLHIDSGFLILRQQKNLINKLYFRALQCAKLGLGDYGNKSLRCLASPLLKVSFTCYLSGRQILATLSAFLLNFENVTFSSAENLWRSFDALVSGRNDEKSELVLNNDYWFVKWYEQWVSDVRDFIAGSFIEKWRVPFTEVEWTY